MLNFNYLIISAKGIMVSAKKYKQGDNNKMVCRVCLKNHPLRLCERFSKADYEENEVGDNVQILCWLFESRPYLADVR